MNKYILILLSFFFLTISFDANAQRIKRKKRRVSTEDTRSSRRTAKEKKKSPMDNLNPEIKIGSIGGGSNNAYSSFVLSLKGNVGYKLNKIFSTGVGGKFSYEYLNYNESFGNTTENNVTIGGFAYARAKFSNFYFQGEYVVQRFPGVRTLPSQTYSYPTIGIGYINVGEKWSVGPELNLILNDDVVDRNGILEYWLNISYNF